MNLKGIVLFFVLLMAVYQDFPLVNTFGEIARSPIVFIIPFFIFYFLWKRNIFISKYSKVYILYIVYLVIISCVYTAFLILKNKSLYFFDENILIKNIKILSYPICSLLFYQFIYLFLKRTKDFTQVFYATMAIQQLLIFVLIFEAQVYKTKEVFLPFLHSDPSKYWRIRLLTLESSWSGSVVIIFTFLPIFLSEYLNRKRTQRILVYCTSLFFFFYYTMHSESKGYLLLLLISLLPMMVTYMYRNKRLRYVLFMVLIPLLISFVVGLQFLDKEFFSQLNTNVSVGTRLTGDLASIKTFVMNPLGVGLGPYLDIYVSNIKSIVDLRIMQQFNLIEVKEYLYSPKFLSSKTYFFDHLVYGGISFLLFFYLFFIKRYESLSKISKTYLIKMILMFIILSSISYITFSIKYEVWFFLALVDVIEKKAQIEKA